ncbi:MAG: sigma-70 family RNA polymerase sigma factor [Microcoleus sp. PH2017_22_RUC_O_B]|uniref:RNA polymerase sigma factor n=1 Tax=unclassified Microcoleus TaxID=2642155 RepID=UPI001DFC7F34|nr:MULTISPECIES: sigma-70 family RNA polymerase sigma factor [unclassified Microcoleus]MCC3527678.1 sigma-70 family RNA polymerase sigma factor [Microcoleus sp. PH2017_21_RUC_O_A]MCC3539780.1 sigma-70 family RNA polymerase sigma factor [Microcoleus sp. PH2017_22_RUC_O_B]
MKYTTNKIQSIRSYSQSVDPSSLWDNPEDIKSVFWQEWQADREHLYRCCLKWMNSNPIDAEDVLSQAMLKAWNEWQNYGGEIKYPKAWFTRIIHNFCMDLHRKRQREGSTIENIEDIKFADSPAFYSSGGFPESNVLDRELRTYLCHKIEALPTRLRDPFVLYYCQDKSYLDIAKEIACSEDNVRKCVRKARIIMQKHLTKYLAGEDETSLDSLSPSLNLVIPLGEKSQPEIRTKSKHEEINYKTTIICLETLPHHWYCSANLLGWR